MRTKNIYMSDLYFLNRIFNNKGLFLFIPEMFSCDMHSPYNDGFIFITDVKIGKLI